VRSGWNCLVSSANEPKEELFGRVFWSDCGNLIVKRGTFGAGRGTSGRKSGNEISIADGGVCGTGGVSGIARTTTGGDAPLAARVEGGQMEIPLIIRCGSFPQSFGELGEDADGFVGVVDIVYVSGTDVKLLYLPEKVDETINFLLNAFIALLKLQVFSPHLSFYAYKSNDESQ
jgi:hypothetical protein